MIYNIIARIIKPRMRQTGPRRWRCYDSLHVGTGSTPEAAFRAWGAQRLLAVRIELPAQPASEP